MVKFYLQITKIFSPTYPTIVYSVLTGNSLRSRSCGFELAKINIFLLFVKFEYLCVLKHLYAGGLYNISNRWGLTPTCAGKKYGK
jgi:hypothetical protein